MPVSSDDLKKRYASYTNERLLEILYNKDEYTPEALEAVAAEVASRKIDNVELRAFTDEKEKIAADQEALFQVGIVTPLSFGEKLLYFFVWFGGSMIAGAFQMNYKEDSLLLKLKQSRSFKWGGFIGLMLTGFLSAYFTLGTIVSFVIYGVMFFLFYLIEKRFTYSFEEK